MLKSLLGQGKLRFDRNEFAGSFGDIGTDLPLIMAMITAAHLDATNVFVMFGLAQIATGLVYGLPMPMQPLKAMAVLVITQGMDSEVLFGAGLAIGATMLLLSLSGLLDWLARVVPTAAVRGIQMGLGLKLATLALGDYVPSGGSYGYLLAGFAFVLGVILLGNRRLPAAIPIMGVGAVFAAFTTLDPGLIISGVGLDWPTFQSPQWSNIVTGFLVLALPQIPLSLSNSVIATNRTLHDLFPERAISIRKIGLTYSIANLTIPWFGGIPVCHGCGGLAGHYAFGARTGGSVVLYGAMYLLIGLFFSGAAEHVVAIFPQPILGIMLVFEALALMMFVRDITAESRQLYIALTVALCALLLPQGFIIGLMVGCALYYAPLNYGQAAAKKAV